MKNCIICDICKRKIDDEVYRIRKKDKSIRRIFYRYRTYPAGYQDIEFDLCPECYQKLILERRMDNEIQKKFHENTMV